jgi:diguanylate cyclase (GGDEF)-like protein
MDQHPSGTHADSDGLWDWNLVSNRIHFSARWMSLIGCQEHELGNTPEEWLNRVHHDDLDQVTRELQAARSQGPHEFDFPHRLRHQDGTYRWMACRGQAIVNERGDVIRLTGSHSDVTANTVTDPITGLPNRLLLLDRLNSSLERARRYQGFHFALLLIDLGRPQALAADGSGRDPLVTAAARRLETSLRIGDTTATLRHNDLVARLEGDRFTVLLDGLKHVSHAKIVADRVLQQLIAPLRLGGRDVLLIPSIGIAVSLTDYATADDVLRDAEIALHRAHVLGGSRCELFDTAVLKSEEAELQLEGDFSQALDRNEFRLLYQPIVSLESNQIVGFEALVRWEHPVLGRISPIDFIPIAERTGFIVRLGNWVLREACLQLKSWRDSRPLTTELWMSVNLSGVQLKHPALVEQVSDALRDSGLDAHSLVLELTEGIAMENPTAVTTLLMKLRATGVRISIDDFGTGYSSLAYLRQLPVDALKVDRSFIRGMETHKGTEIVATLAAMAQQLGVAVVAEGIENEAQLALVQSLRCDSAQGYFFAKPLDANTATDLITSGLPPRSGKVARTHSAPVLEKSGRAVLRYGRRLSPRVRTWAAAAALILLASVGLVAPFVNAAGPAVPPPSAFDRAASTKSTDLAITTLISDVVPVTPAPSALSTVSGRSTGVPSTTSPNDNSDVVASRGEAVQQPAETNAPVQAPPQHAPSDPRSIDVAHLHRFGSCHGRLVLSDDGLAFVVDQQTSKDGFTFKHSEFLYTLADNQLTIRSNNRIYRFETGDIAGEGSGGVHLRDFVENITRLR